MTVSITPTVLIFPLLVYILLSPRLNLDSLRITDRLSVHVPIHHYANKSIHTITQAVTIQPRPPLPPFTKESAIQKVRAAENAWNTRDPWKVSLAYTPDSRWRNRSEFLKGRQQIVDFLTRKWERENGYRLIKELWAYEGNRIAVRFVYEWYDHDGQWFRAHGNENWEFDSNGLMKSRHASINDVPIVDGDRLFRWQQGIRPESYPGLTALGL